MVKFISLSLLFIAPSALGLMMARSSKKEYEEFLGLIELLKYIKNELIYFKTKQTDILSKFQNPALERCGFIDLLRRKKQDPLKDAFSGKPPLSVSQRVLTVMQDFSNSFGTIPYDLQIIKCDETVFLLDSMKNDIKTTAEKNVNLYKTVGFSIGAALLIMFI